jgi:hypothetical protein
MHTFKAAIDIIGVNPFVFVPCEILEEIFNKAGQSKGPIPIHGLINGTPFTQTLVRYGGEWRLYVNTKMLKNSPQRISEVVELSIDFDPTDRSIPLHPKLQQALENDPIAQQKFNALSPSLQHEINRYISRLKTDVSMQNNVQRAVDFLNGKASFVGRQALEPFDMTIGLPRA